jgi:hypothetical protein
MYRLYFEIQPVSSATSSLDPSFAQVTSAPTLTPSSATFDLPTEEINQASNSGTSAAGDGGSTGSIIGGKWPFKI